MLTASNISKSFSGVKALDKISLDLPAGHVTAIIGENGAGKSTLMKILSGVYTEFDGQVMLKGKAYRFRDTREARDQGIAIIHQELAVVPGLSVAENIFLGNELGNAFGLTDRKAMRERSAVLLKRLHLDVDPDTKMSALKVGQQQVVEIAKALLYDASVIIMDEPTSAIGDREAEVLFHIIHELRKEGRAIAYISHKLDELLRIADRYVVLRDGRSVDAGIMKGLDKSTLVKLMAGRELSNTRHVNHSGEQVPALEIQGWHMKGKGNGSADKLKNISFTLHKNEVLGIFGLMGAGRTELLESMFGLHPGSVSGTMRVHGAPVRFTQPAHAIAAGLALVPEDRKKDGLVLDMSVSRNISLTTLAKCETRVLLDGAKEKILTDKMVHDLRIKAGSIQQSVATLSGGNQQKVVIGKWLATDPTVLMLDEPTRGIDVGTKSEIHDLLRRLAAEGRAILVSSSEMPELLALCDRILVLNEGGITANVNAADADEDILLSAAIPKSTP